MNCHRVNLFVLLPHHQNTTATWFLVLSLLGNTPSGVESHLAARRFTRLPRLGNSFGVHFSEATRLV